MNLVRRFGFHISADDLEVAWDRPAYGDELDVEELEVVGESVTIAPDDPRTRTVRVTIDGWEVARSDAAVVWWVPSTDAR